MLRQELVAEGLAQEVETLVYSSEEGVVVLTLQEGEAPEINSSKEMIVLQLRMLEKSS